MQCSGNLKMLEDIGCLLLTALEWNCGRTQFFHHSRLKPTIVCMGGGGGGGGGLSLQPNFQKKRGGDRTSSFKQK